MGVSYFHFVPFGLEKTVIDSQLVTPALKLQKEGLPVHLLVMEDIPTWLGLFSRRRRTVAEDRLKGLPVTFLPRVPRNLFFLNTLILGVVLWPVFLRRDRVVIHARGFQGAGVLVPLRRLMNSLRLICDVRGLEADEYIYGVMKKKGSIHGIQRWWGQHLSYLSQRALRFSDVIFCVSQAMKQHLMNGVEKKDVSKWEWIPCSVDVTAFSRHLEKRAEKRLQLGVKDRLVVVYSGAFRDWQMPPASVALFKLIKSIHPQAFFLCLTPDVQNFQELIANAGLLAGDAVVKNVTFDEMPSYLAAGDVGLLIRENHPLNLYACPTKFAEYLACGLHVLATAAIKDVAQVIQSEFVGTLVDVDGDQNQLTEALRAGLRISELEMTRMERSVSAAIRLYDWTHYIPIIKKWYLELGK